jgi:RES domain-containing protein
MIVYRIAHQKYARDLTGTGAKLAGGRWNSPGNRMLYTAGSISLAILEVAVHLSLEKVPKGFKIIVLEIPDEYAHKSIDRRKLPINWSLSIHAPFTQNIGDVFLEKNEFLTLQVPSAIVPEEYNYLINPLHPAFSLVKILDIRDMNFDSRLFKA